MQFLEDGGFTMIPILVLGFCLVGASGLDALRPAARLRPVMLSLAAVVGTAGALGFVMAVNTTLRNCLEVADPQRMTMIIAGVAESANNLVLALVFLVLAALISAVGAIRGRALTA
jgi:hypothetical protein